MEEAAKVAERLVVTEGGGSEGGGEGGGGSADGKEGGGGATTIGMLAVTVVTDKAPTTSKPRSADRLDSGRLTKLLTVAPMVAGALADWYDGSQRDTSMLEPWADITDGDRDGSSSSRTSSEVLLGLGKGDGGRRDGNAVGMTGTESMEAVKVMRTLVMTNRMTMVKGVMLAPSIWKPSSMWKNHTRPASIA